MPVFYVTGNPRRLVRMASAAIAVGATIALPLPAFAQDSALKCDEVQVISHASPGGGTDTTIRMWMDAAAKIMNTNFVVVYKQGGGARVAQQYLANQPADGCTIMATTETHLYTIARGQSPLKIDDLQGVARAMRDPSVIVTKAGGDIKSYDDLIKASKDKQGGLNWGVAQIGGTEHIGISRWAEKAGVPYRIVPFGSGGEMITALRSGAVDATLANVSEAMQPIKDKQINPVAVLAEHTIKDLPDTPTAASKGADVTVDTTRGYVVLAKTPMDKVKELSKVLVKAMHSDRFVDYLKNSGLDPETSIAGYEKWNAELKKDYANAAEAMKKLGLTKKQ